MHIKFITFLLITLIAFSGNLQAESAPADDDASTEELQSGNGWQVIRTVPMGKTKKFVYFVLVEQKRYTDKTIYSAAINRLCKKKKDLDFCRIRFWSELQYIPEKLSMTTFQYKQLKAEYLDNRTSGTRKLTWACSVDPDRNHCLDL